MVIGPAVGSGPGGGVVVGATGTVVTPATTGAASPPPPVVPRTSVPRTTASTTTTALLGPPRCVPTSAVAPTVRQRSGRRAEPGAPRSSARGPGRRYRDGRPVRSP